MEYQRQRRVVLCVRSRSDIHERDRLTTRLIQVRILPFVNINVTLGIMGLRRLLLSQPQPQRDVANVQQQRATR